MAAVPDELIAGESATAQSGRRVLDRLMRAIEITEAVVGALLVVVILALVMIQVALRFTPTAGWAWTGELAKYAMVWATFILSGYLMGRGQHVTLDVIDHFLPKRALRVVVVLAQLITMIICLAAVYEGYHLVTDQVGLKSPAAQIPMSVVYVVPMIGMGLTAVRLLVNIVFGRKA